LELIALELLVKETMAPEQWKKTSWLGKNQCGPLWRKR
jgi:hypothetical protein